MINDISFYAHNSPYELLIIQQRCSAIICDGDTIADVRADMQALLDTVNMALVARGRCTCCGLQHNVMDCQRVTGRNLEEDEDDFDMHNAR